jgi:uncharacterized protein YjbI with pentapeptide repeats
MRNVPLRRLVIALTSGLVIFAAFAAGIGIYAAALASWPLLLVWWPWMLVGAVPVVALSAWWSWWRLPKRQVDRLRLIIRDPKARADVEDNFRKTISQMLLAAAALVGAGFAYLQFTEQLRNTQKQFVEQQDASRKQFEEQQDASRKQFEEQQKALLISNQVAKSFELLGNSKEIMQRLGGIYVLEGVMNNSEDYHEPVLEALSAFVREETKTKTGPPPTDIQAALTVIGRRKTVGKEKPVDLANAHLNGADLHDAHLNDAHLMFTHLNGANLDGADLNHADLGGANLNGARLIGTHLNGTDLTDASLIDAYLSDAHLNDAYLIRTHLNGARLDGAHFNDADLSGAHLEGAHLNDAVLLADLIGAHLNHADLSGAHLEGDLSGADLTNAQYLTQEQLDKACGTGVKGLDKLSPPLTIKPCP